MTFEVTDDQHSRIVDALYGGRKIEAIKIYRQATNCDLLTAKTFIEELETRLRGETPERFTAAPAQGCSGAALLIVIFMVFLLGGALGAYTAMQLGTQPSVVPTPKASQAAVNASLPGNGVVPKEEQGPPFADDLSGRWALNLPAGFEHAAGLERVDDTHYRLSTKGVMNGVYEVRGQRLVMQEPVDKRQVGMSEFRWQIENGQQLKLVGQPDPGEYNGGHYLGATLTKAK